MKKIMKEITFLICGIFLCIFTFTSCEDNQYDKEMYKPILYLLSTGNHNVYNVVYPFGVENAVGYFSIGCSGSKPNPETITIELESDTVLMNEYNRINFGVDSASYAKLLPSGRYEFESYTVTFPANNKEQYIKVPVKVNQEGLSPDSIYFIPLNIKSVSNYEISQDRRNMLLRVLVENDYAEQITQTTYYQRAQYWEDGKEEDMYPANGPKIVQPLSKDEIRMYAGKNTQDNKASLDSINAYAMVLKINEDHSVDFRSYANLDVEKLDRENFNRYYTRLNSEYKQIQYFDLYYRFRVKKGNAYGSWIVVEETLERLN
jgi:uncharacterized protein YxeA